MTKLQTAIPLNTWVPIAWEAFLALADRPESATLKSYYYQGKVRLEAMSTGSDHSTDHHLLIFAISLFATLHALPIRGKDACSYRKVGITEFQPDVSYYIGPTVDAVPWGTRVIDLDVYPVPDLVIEVADTSIADDQGHKRSQYEALGIPEYWILDVQGPSFFAVAISADGSSRPIRVSQVLPGLRLEIVEEALRRSRQMEQSAVGAWLMEELR